MPIWSYVKERLFPTRKDTIISCILIAFIMICVGPLMNWLFFDANFVGTKSSDCIGEGACWVFIKERFGQIMFGFYAEDQRWRPMTAILFLAIVGAMLGKFNKSRLVLSLVAYVMLAVLTIWGLIWGGAPGLAIVTTDQWGGLMLTLIVAGIGILLSLPLGVILALCRRSQLPVFRYTSIVFIEFWRGVPLITVLFMASVMLPLFLPEGVEFDKLLRCLIGVTLFSSAYMAEVVRGGLQAIPKGQYEAAEALGLSYWQSMGGIILPQALKTVIPGIVNTFIGLFKDTTLVLIVGLFDLLGVIQASMTDPEWLGFSLEGYVFAGFIFWVFCYAMARYSQKIESELTIQRS